nr:hypothetical protein [Nesterenkonia sp. AN1]
MPISTERTPEPSRVMTSASRSWVIGRGGIFFSMAIAMALASAGPTKTAT